ncbi:hypothetical protein ASG67_13500 [Sphingomonas sp. Leaf339]|uniref:DMT family transporter n=1 Tax=Sphingomonas sp. Leaf339 TaxID=1736343 RepID=UPI0006F2CB96|nr:DMT family transporter [Sphingomonas sp. Leaf339]KQU47286.1 hypothetical protein ASG67_13500 [Sphingomonas sp. Leaf339]
MRPTPAVVFAVAALGIGVFSVMDAAMKALVLAIGVYNTMFWRAFGNVAIGGALWSVGPRIWPDRRTLGLHLARGGVTTAMALLFFWGLARVPMTLGVAIGYTAPILALGLAVLFLGERAGWRALVAGIAALAGIGIILAGQSRSASAPAAWWGSVAILASAMLYAINLILARLQALAAKPVEIALFQSVVVLATLALAAPWLMEVPPVGLVPLLGIAAVLGSISMLLLGWAYARGEASYLAATEYTSFVWAAALGWIVFGEAVSIWTLAGAAVIVAACLFAARRRDIAASAAVGAQT